MNERLRPSSLPAVTQAAEGLPRRRWAVAEIQEMVAKGIILEDERFELIGGEVVPMSPKGVRHELVKKALQQHWIPLVSGSHIDVITETTLYIGVDEFLEPDFLFWPRSLALKDVTPAAALLIVEVADSSLGYDLSVKAPLYATHGVPEYWVIHATSLQTRIHRGPGGSGYSQVDEAAGDARLVPQAAPQLAVTLRDLAID
jgi:Uma2 family endonuclease